MFCRTSQAETQQKNEVRSMLCVNAVLSPSETNPILGTGSLSHLSGRRMSQSINIHMQKSIALSLALNQPSSLPCKLASIIHNQICLEIAYRSFSGVIIYYHTAAQGNNQDPVSKFLCLLCQKVLSANLITLLGLLRLELFSEQQHQLLLMLLLVEFFF